MSIARALLDIIYPPFCASCGTRLSGRGLFFLCSRCEDKVLLVKAPVCGFCGAPGPGGRCGRCAGERRSFSLSRSAALYAGPAAEAMKLFKYGPAEWLGETLCEILRKGLKEFPELGRADLILPAPISRLRLKERGFNQSEVFARAAGEFLGKSVSSCNLVRLRHSAPQAGLSGRERRDNVRGVFRVKNGEELSGKRVLLVDDVFTTGSTADECAAELVSAGASEAMVFTLARRL